MSELSLSGSVALVTGAGSGLGRAHALALSRRGAAVVINDITGADTVAAEIVAEGGTAVAVTGSVADRADARRAVECALDGFGTLDIVINNAGIGGIAPFHEESLDRFEQMIAVHLLGAAAVTHAAWPILRAKSYGRVVMTTSTAGLWGVAGFSAYGAAKAGVVGLTKSLAHEGRDAGIMVNAIAPGAKTAMSRDLFTGGAGSGGWTWRPEIVSPLVVYLASAECRHNGEVFTAMAGHFARTQMLQAAGARIDPRHEIDAEQVRDAIAEICDMTDARQPVDGLGEVVNQLP